jgi:hypothetical protein
MDAGSSRSRASFWYSTMTQGKTGYGQGSFTLPGARPPLPSPPTALCRPAE